MIHIIELLDGNIANAKNPNNKKLLGKRSNISDDNITIGGKPYLYLGTNGGNVVYVQSVRC